MEIYLSEAENANKRFVFPSLPERIKVRNQTNYQNYDIISIGQIKTPKGMMPTNISWSGVFFGWAKRRESIVKHWQSPAVCDNTLKQWQENGTVLRLLVTGTNINIDVTISDYACEENGGYGNKDYSIEFERYKYLKIYTTDELKIVKFVKQVVTRPAAPPEAATRTYTVVPGDTLWGISRRFYGGIGLEWQRIYDANSSLIESTASIYRGSLGSDNGNYIYPGCVLTIP